jgi:hypothetical protein
VAIVVGAVVGLDDYDDDVDVVDVDVDDRILSVF